MQFASVLGDLRDDYVNEAAEHRKPRRLGMKLGAAAACLCLIGGLVWWRMQPGVDSIYENAGGGSGVGNILPAPTPDGSLPAGGAPVPGGYFEDERSAKLYSIAVYPETEDFSDVADATLTDISEQEVRSDPLGAYFPTVLPEGYEFDFASLYETTMKSGWKYHLLRVTYAAGGEVHPVPTEDGGYTATEAARRSFVLFATDYMPSAKGVFVDGSRLPELDLSILSGGDIVRFAFDRVYLSASASELSQLAEVPEELEAMLASLPVLNG